MEKIIDIKDLELQYPKANSAVIQGVNFQIEKGSLTALLGENGMGKSTLLKAMAGLLGMGSGSILINGQSLQEIPRPALARLVAVVLTEPVNLGLLKVQDFVSFGRYPFTNWLGKLSKQDHQGVLSAIAQCGVDHLVHRFLSDLSDGERQKVMIARALAQECPIILLDEPTTHLDLRNSRAIFALLHRLCKEEGKTILFSTHQIEPALQLADQLLIHTCQQVRACSTKDFFNDAELQKQLLGEDSKLDPQSGSIQMKFD